MGNLKLHTRWSLSRRMVGGGSFEGGKSRNDLVEFGVGGALRGDEGAMVLDQNGDGFLKQQQ